jgi:Uncharacterised protein family (UPF0236)
MTLVEEIINAVNAWSQQLQQFQQQHSEEGSKLATLEQAAQQLGRKVAQVALRQSLEGSDSHPVASSFECRCEEGRLTYQRLSWRTVRTLVGEVRYNRSYYYCRACGASRCPMDEQLGQTSREISAGVERILALLCAHLPFAIGAMILEEITGLSLSSKQTQTVVEAIGEESDSIEKQASDQASKQALAQVIGPEASSSARRVWIVEMDGVMAPMRGGGSSEVKVGIIYELGNRVQISKDRWELQQRQRCEVRGSCEEFRRRLWAMMIRVGVREEDKIVVIGDGAEWINQTVEVLFYSATRIMDFYHVAERIWTVGAARFGEASQQTRQWAHEKLSLMKAGEVGRVLRALNKLKIEKAEAEARRAEAVRYISNHAEGMAYDRYKAENLPIGSGAIEGSCKHLVTARCKQAGMRWSERGIDAILALRCWVLNGRLDELRPKPRIEIQWAEAA